MTEAGIDLIRLGIYLAKKEKFDWEELGDGDVKNAVRAAMDEKNTLRLQSFLEGLGVIWDTNKPLGDKPVQTPVEAIEKTMKMRLATKKLRELLQKDFGLKFNFTDQTTIDKIKPMLSNEVLKKLGIEPNEESKV